MKRFKVFMASGGHISVKGYPEVSNGTLSFCYWTDSSIPERKVKRVFAVFKPEVWTHIIETGEAK